MKTRQLLQAAALGLGLTVALVSVLTRHVPSTRANSSVYYVREDADGDCLSITTPCSNVQHAINLAVASGPGNEVLVAGGTYTENLVITDGVRLRGGWNAPSFTVQIPGGTPTILDGGGITHNVRVVGALQSETETTIESLTLRNGDDGIHVQGGRVTVERCTIQNAAQQGVVVDGGAITLINNTIYDTGADGIHVDDGVTVTIQGNTVYSSGNDGIDASGDVIFLTRNGVSGCADGIHVDDGVTVTIQENTVYGSGNDGIDASGDVVVLTRNGVSGCADGGIRAGGGSIHVEANRVLSSGVGIAARGPATPLTNTTSVFTITNNMVAGHVTASVELTGAGAGFVAHNTLVGSGLGNGLAALGPLTITVVNNIVVSHAVGITATAEAIPSTSHTLLWANATDPISGTYALLAPPHFATPALQNYHLRADSPAIDAGIEIGVFADIDGDPRPTDVYPDIGADEFRIHAVYLPCVMKTHPPLPPPSPLYRLYADPNDLNWLAQEPYRDETIPATFCAPSPTGTGEKCWDVDVRYRGDTARLMPKKSWKIFFPSSNPFRGQMGVSYELNLNADYVDQSLLRSFIGYDLFARAGVPTPRAGYARLHINDEYYGLFSQVEQVDQRFLHRYHIEMHGNLYKPYYGNLGLEPNDWWYSYHYPKKTNRQSGHQDLVAFIELINYTPDEQFAGAIAEVLDVNGWLDWYAVNILIGNFEMMNKNYYVYHDFSADRWMILPWDVDIALGHNEGNPYGLFDRDISWDNPIDTGADPTAKYNHLIDRMMRVPEFRFHHCRLLTELMASQFSPAEMFPRIDATYDYIYAAAVADPNRWRPDLEGYPGFEDGPDELKTYIANRIQFLEGEMLSFCPDLALPLTINEFMADNSSTVTDEAGDADAWIEIHNASSTLAWDVGGMYLTDVLSEPVKWRIPTEIANCEPRNANCESGTLIPPGGTLLIWADGEEGEGSLHTNFALDASGGQIGFFDRDVFGNAAISVLTYTAQSADVSYGRMPDGDETWQFFAKPTPGWPNQGRPPIISGTIHTPAWPVGGNVVTAMTTITDEGTVIATLWYRTFAPGVQPPGYQSTPMTTVSGTTWQAVLPAQPDGTWVEYYVEAEDAIGMTTVDRPGWPLGDYRYIVGWQRPSLYLNELMAINSRTLEDDAGETDDWLEIYNAGPVDVDLGGMYLSDNIDSDTPFTILNNTIVPAGGHLILWADGDGTGGHLNFRLSGAGEYVGLFDSQAHYYAPVDAVYFPPQTVDVSWGRFPEPLATGGTPASGQGSSEWHAMTTPTPGEPNRLLPPQFSQVTRTPAWPNAGEAVTVTAVITAGTPIISATLWYDAGSGFQAIEMAVISMTTTVIETTWQVALSPQITSTLVRYYLEAMDSVGQITRHPSAAPAATHRYLVGYAPPDVVVNEFLADNESVNQDEAGEYDDWVELYNASAVTVTLDGMHLTDSLTEPTEWQIPAGTTIPPGGHLLVWCDRNAGQGPLHADFKLDRDGEEIGLFDSMTHGLVPLDWITFGPQQEDVSYGRRPDGADRWEFLNPPTPGVSN